MKASWKPLTTWPNWFKTFWWHYPFFGKILGKRIKESHMEEIKISKDFKQKSLSWPVIYLNYVGFPLEFLIFNVFFLCSKVFFQDFPAGRSSEIWGFQWKKSNFMHTLYKAKWISQCRYTVVWVLFYFSGGRRCNCAAVRKTGSRDGFCEALRPAPEVSHSTQGITNPLYCFIA